MIIQFSQTEKVVFLCGKVQEIFTYRKNKKFEKPGLEIKAHPPSILARSANMFSGSFFEHDLKPSINFTQNIGDKNQAEKNPHETSKSICQQVS
uniref:Uncharacterized protein n=1 Tax=Candidatus Kentrum sp. UNK TaxID=2126344 RepID=A0A451B5I0_9GAMM|nr:MAG: hypothetical protein BECKUNK1418G_GA0071005_12354 [Candidatus Kentron sp. UNK]VFK73544.1 MAG: hypothetical protein BECKUNK1418H_GA0071006_12173 [Candidatus Kentron sp. UNK]